ncbi:H(+)/Cl(-) exchange transporter 7 isoform X2 [Halyomorpha halys]|uniref:H(+)/Cl(-) exchange transporter 7 isoform X2 n=1 Tax=Halyomorpha halys TaxID=286706 RepID=UPI0006D4CC6C|nr:H(+)/Cl(-) exchange transporter 7 isoform X2 [Halyomorpha halys]
MGLLSLMDYYQKRPSRQVLTHTLYSINKEYSAINFNAPESKIRSEIDKNTDLQYYYISSVMKKWLAIITLGIFIGTMGSIQEILIKEMTIFKNNCFKPLLKNVMTSSFVWIFWTVFPILVCSYLVVEEAPSLKGCGVASVMAYLNGVKINKFHKPYTLCLLYLMIFLISAANMPGGREELFIHFGAMSGAYITRLRLPFSDIRPFLSVSNRLNMRTLVAAGTAAGVSVSFGTPIDSSFNLEPYLFFSGAEDISLIFKYLEIPLFILMGAFGGLLGSLWNEGQILLQRFRNTYIKTKRQKIMEAVIVGLDLSVCGIVIFHYFEDECTPVSTKVKREEACTLMQVYCENKDEFETVGIFLFQDLRHTIRSLFIQHKEIMSYSVILFGGIYYYVFAEIQLGTYLPTGVLIPHLICGASWGYLVGIWYSQAPEGNVIAKYAFLGALAQGSGAARLTLSLGIIMIESCGQQMFSLPIFIIVVTAKWFGGIFSRPIYRIATYLEGYPFLRATYLPISTPYKAKHIMITPMAYLPPRITVKGLIEALLKKHQVFPVIENEKVVGIITKYQIAVILKSKIYNFPENFEKIHLMNEMLMEYEGESFVELEDAIYSEDIPDAKQYFDLTNFMCTSTNLINMEMSLRKIYLMFVSLGLSYVIVIDDDFKALGIITRKDIACFRKRSQFLLMRTEVLPLV